MHLKCNWSYNYTLPSSFIPRMKHIDVVLLLVVLAAEASVLGDELEALVHQVSVLAERGQRRPENKLE